MDDKLVLDAVKKTVPCGPFAQAEVARVFFQQHRISKVAEEVAGDTVGQRRSVTLPVSLHALPVRWEVVLGLADAGLQSDDTQGHGIKGGPEEQAELLVWSKRRSVLAVGDPKLRQYAEDAP